MKVLSDALFKNKVLMNDKEVVPTSIEKWNIELTQMELIFQQRMFLRYVLKQPLIPLFSGYNFEFYTEFFRLVIILKN